MSLHTIIGSRQNYHLSVEAITSTIEEHSSFDYEIMTNQISQVTKSNHTFTLNHKYIYVFRHEKSKNNPKVEFELYFEQRQNLKVNPYPQNVQLLTIFQIRYIDHNIVLRFYQPDDLVYNNRYSEENQQVIKNKISHQVYIIVRSMKNHQSQSIGYKLKEGGLLKIGQKQFFISSVSNDANKKNERIQDKLMLLDSILCNHKKLVVPQDGIPGECKYCMMEEGEEIGEFLCSPCKCSGSCGLVHFNCLEKWNQSKVKKSQVKGLTYYNFQKFFCEVCKEQYPKIIEKRGKAFELMPIQMPKGNHLILQQLDLKAFTLICIENIPSAGIKMGRGTQCQIRVDSSSVSRNHARICQVGGEYVIFDNKSKYGTTIRDSKTYLKLDMTKKGVQIDRTILMMRIVRNNILE